MKKCEVQCKAVIPPQYKEEYEKLTVELIQRRIRVFSAATFILFLISMILTFLPGSIEGFNWGEIPFDLLILAVALAGFFFARKMKRKIILKPFSYFINAAILFAFTAYYHIYPETFYLGCLPLMFVAFVVMLAMPWQKIEVVVVFLSAALLFSIAVLASTDPIVKTSGYLSANIIILLFGAIMSAIFKHCDARRREEQFILRKEIEEKNIVIEKELELAKQVQRSLIPKSFSNKQVDIAVSYLPFFYVGGDYAKFEFLDENRLLIFIMDITGHGVSAALLVNRLHAEIGSLARGLVRPGELLKALDGFVQKSFEGTQKFLTACACVVDFKKGKLQYSNFGHPPQILYQNKTKEIHWLSPQHHMLGIAASPTDEMHETELTFEKGDRVLLFTDGILEVKGRDGDFFGQKRLEGFIQSNKDLQPELFNQKLIAALDGYKAESINDDVFLLNIQIK